jgi:hypothetical protein
MAGKNDDAVRRAFDSQGTRFPRFFEGSFEGFIISGLAKQLHSAHASIEDVKHHSPVRHAAWRQPSIAVPIRN